MDRTAGQGAGEGAEDALLPVDIERFRPLLQRYFTRHLGAAGTEIEDLAQDALLRLHRACAHAPIDNHEAYLVRIASNLVKDRQRRRQAEPMLDALPEDAVDSGGAGEVPGPDRVYEDNRRLQDFLRLLDELPPRCREVFLLQRFEGMTYGAIADRLGISVSGVEKHMMKALLHFDSRMARA